MSWNNAHTPQIWPPVFKDLVLIALAVYRFRRRSLPSVLPFANPLQSGSIWIVGSGLELAIVDAATKISWVK